MFKEHIAEFTLHEDIAEEIECETYFAKPYHSWERGQDKNANGLLRQYFPKNMELLDITVRQVVIAVDKLNSRPRKCLKFKTPYQWFGKFHSRLCERTRSIQQFFIIEVEFI